MGSIVGGISKAVGGVLHGGVDLLTGHPIQAVKDTVGGVVGGAVETLKNPLVDFGVGSLLFGGPLVGGLLGGFLLHTTANALEPNQPSLGQGMSSQMGLMQQQQMPGMMPMGYGGYGFPGG
jgi:hypothetical protein